MLNPFDLPENVMASEHDVEIVLSETLVLSGTLALPIAPRGLVLFAHGSGSSRKSPRNRYVADVLQHAGFATLLFDLLTAEEERLDLATGELRFDVSLLAERLLEATRWAARHGQIAELPVGYFGASTGAAAALLAAAAEPRSVFAVVSRGGRPDLAGQRLSLVRAPTLLIVGGDDREVLELNRRAQEQLRCENALQVVPGATHLFQEPGTLEDVALLASQWFAGHLSLDRRRPPEQRAPS